MDLIADNTPDLVPNTTNTAFKQLVDATLATVGSNSVRIYRQTFSLWADWCRQQQIDPLHLLAANVRLFLMDQPVSASTRQRQLSALRKLARVLALDYSNGVWRSFYESLLLLRAPTEGIVHVEREMHALSPSEVTRVLAVWSGASLIHKRNQALLALLFLTGLRRSEIVALRWIDLDLLEGVVQIRHGKGDKPRTVAIAGEMAIQALTVWQAALGHERAFVFCAVGKGGKLGLDKAMTDQAVYILVKQSERLSGVSFSPHDARRTFITEALITGAPLADVQAQAGHKQESTTLRYAKPVEARQRRTRLRLRYGG